MIYSTGKCLFPAPIDSSVSRPGFTGALVFLLILISSCRLELKEPPGPPGVSPSGLWIYQKGERLEILRIVCGTERCWFRDSVVVRRDLPVSGRVVNLTERNGYLETSARELLQVQTEYLSEQFQLPAGSLLKAEPSQVRSVIDRIVRGESRLRLLHWDGPDRLTDGDALFVRRCPATLDCVAPLVYVLETADGEVPALVVSADLPWMHVPEGLPEDLLPVLKAGPVYYARTQRSAGTILAVAGKKKTDLALLYESRIALLPGPDANELLHRNMDARALEKQKRIADIKKRLRKGDPVSREEMIEALDGQ